jgi:hypothetical protein
MAIIHDHTLAVNDLYRHFAQTVIEAVHNSFRFVSSSLWQE